MAAAMSMPGGGDMFTRDLDTLDEDGPDLTGMEADSAREPAMESRPAFSPVTQPSMDGAIWWHTVEDNRAARAAAAEPTDGMIDRLNGPGPAAPAEAPPGPGRRQRHRRRHRGRRGQGHQRRRREHGRAGR